VRSQKEFLDVVAEEAANTTEGAPTTHGKKTELTELAREGAEAFIDAQKKLLDVAAQQVAVNLKVARKTMDVMNPLPQATLADLTRQTVDGFVAAQKSLLDLMTEPAHAAAPEKLPKPAARKRPAAEKRHAAASAQPHCAQCHHP